MFHYLSANKLITKNQSGFQPGDSCINQLLLITHKTFASFHDGLEVRSIFSTYLKLLKKSVIKDLFSN